MDPLLETEGREGSGEQKERGSERQVRHLVRVKEGKHGEEIAERECQRLSKREKISSESLCLTVYMLFTREKRSRYQEQHMSLSKVKAYTV